MRDAIASVHTSSGALTKKRNIVMKLQFSIFEVEEIKKRTPFQKKCDEECKPVH